MVKGVSKQVIVVQSPDRKLYDQAIFILSDQAIHSRQVTESMVLQEANRLLKSPRQYRTGSAWNKLIWCGVGAAVVGALWILGGYL